MQSWSSNPAENFTADCLCFAARQNYPTPGLLDCSGCWYLVFAVAQENWRL